MENFLKLFDLIGELARRRYQLAEQKFLVLGLNHTESRLLTLLDRENGEATQEGLSNMLFVDRSNAGRGLKKLEQAGYIARIENEGDKRTKIVRITAKGREAVAKISKVKERIVQNFFGDLREDEARIIFELLQKSLTKETNK